MKIVEGQNQLEGAEYMRLDVPVIIEDTSDDDDGSSQNLEVSPTPRSGFTPAVGKTPLP